MTLFEHLRELRYRLVVIAIALVLGLVIALVFHEQLFAVIMHPYHVSQALIKAEHPGIKVQTIVEGVTSSFTLVMKVCLVAALIATSPVWLYQIWAFIVPGLLAKEKKWTLAFLGAAIPLFLLGVALAYTAIPKGIAVMMGFNPDPSAITNLLDVQGFLTFLIRVMVVFGLGFELPVFIIALNLVGILSGKVLKKIRSFVIFGCFVFGAVATPSTDPISMMLLAAPMVILYLAAEVFVHIREKRLGRNGDIDAGAGIANDRTLAELEGRDPDAPVKKTSTSGAAQRSVADLLGLGPSNESGDAQGDGRS